MLVISSMNLFKEKREITIQREGYELEENETTLHLMDNLNKQLSKTYILYVIYQKNSLVSVL